MNKLALIIFSAVFLVSCNSKEVFKETTTKSAPKTETYYTCSMHPKVKEHKPGKCPICHMNLTKVEVDHSDHKDKVDIVRELWQCKDFPETTSEYSDTCPIDGTPMVKISSAGKTIARVKLRKSQLSHFKPEYFLVTKMKMNKKIRLLGTVLQSEDKESNIPARIGGRVEKVYIKSTGSLISSGDPVVDIYSPKLITAGEEYLIAKKSYKNSKSTEFKEMIGQSEQRLKLWGIKASQFKSWYRKGKVPKSITIYSSATGIVRKRNAVVGKYFKEGQNFFELSDLSEVWIQMDVYEQDSNLVKIDQNVKMQFNAIPGEVFNGKIDFINPILNMKSRTLKVRSTIRNNDGNLKPGMVADSTLEVLFDTVPLVVPRSAVIDTGKRKVVWVKINEKSFQAKTVLTGVESEGYIEIKNGLMEDEQVVIEGNFLLDAQAQLFGGYEDFKPSTTHKH